MASRSPNNILFRKPNQFPRTRMKTLKFSKESDVYDIKINGSLSDDTNDDEDTNKPEGEESEQFLDRLRNRFKEPEYTCPPVDEGQN